MENVLIVEDHGQARDVMHGILSEAFAGPQILGASTIEQARIFLKNGIFDLVVLDLDLPDGRGEEFIAEILSSHPTSYIVISTIHDESERLLTALENGAKGYLLKEQSPEKLVEAFIGIKMGQPPLAPAVTRRILEFMRLRNNVARAADSTSDKAPQPLSSTSIAVQNIGRLTEREKEILRLIAKGFNRPEIAGILTISKHTVATHLAKIYEKLDVTTRSEAIILAYEAGLT